MSGTIRGVSKGAFSNSHPLIPTNHPPKGNLVPWLLVSNGAGSVSFSGPVLQPLSGITPTGGYWGFLTCAVDWQSKADRQGELELEPPAFNWPVSWKGSPAPKWPR